MTHAASPPPHTAPEANLRDPGGKGEGRHRIAHALFGPTDRTNMRWSMPYRATLSHTSEQVRRFGHTVLFMVIAMDAPQYGSSQTHTRRTTVDEPRRPTWRHSVSALSAHRCYMRTLPSTIQQVKDGLRTGVTRFHV